MRKVFNITKGEFATLRLPSTFMGLRIPYKKRVIAVHPQLAINAIWEALGEKYGFVPTTVRKMSNHTKLQFSAKCTYGE